MLRYPIVLLDVGGTLIGPRGSFGQVYSEVFADYGLRVSDATFEQSIYRVWDEMNRLVPSGANRYEHFQGGENGYWIRFVMRTVEHASGEMIGERLANAALRTLRERFGEARSWRVFDDVTPALERLRELGARLAVVSNWDSRLPEVLNLLELDRWFETVVVSHFEGVEKPSAEIFRRALERLGAAPGDALHVGDSVELDGGGATAAGIDWVRVDRVNPLPEPGALPDFTRLAEVVEFGRERIAD